MAEFFKHLQCGVVQLQIIMIMTLQVFKAFEGSLGVYGDGEGNIRSTLHGQPEDGDYDNHNVTYTEKVGPGTGTGGW